MCNQIWELLPSEPMAGGLTKTVEGYSPEIQLSFP